MLIELAWLIFDEQKVRSLFSDFHSSVALHTLEHSRTDHIKHVVNQLQPVSGDAKLTGHSVPLQETLFLYQFPVTRVVEL
jgi:hypothetical protein